MEEGTASAKGLRWIRAWDIRQRQMGVLEGREQVSGRAAGSTEIPLTHMRHPFMEDGYLESLEQVAMLTFEFLPAFSRGGLGE